jgi:hypothetical protein
MAGFEDVTAVTTKSTTIFWDVMVSFSVEIYRRFGEHGASTFSVEENANSKLA